jgi:hypothetical protein
MVDSIFRVVAILAGYAYRLVVGNFVDSACPKLHIPEIAGRTQNLSVPLSSSLNSYVQ